MLVYDPPNENHGTWTRTTPASYREPGAAEVWSNMYKAILEQMNHRYVKNVMLEVNRITTQLQESRIPMRTSQTSNRYRRFNCHSLGAQDTLSAGKVWKHIRNIICEFIKMIVVPRPTHHNAACHMQANKTFSFEFLDAFKMGVRKITT